MTWCMHACVFTLIPKHKAWSMSSQSAMQVLQIISITNIQISLNSYNLTKFSF